MKLAELHGYALSLKNRGYTTSTIDDGCGDVPPTLQ